MERKKIIHKLRAHKINERFLILYVLAAAGTYIYIDLFFSYIKEFVHSDLERTRPSVCDLLSCDCDIYQLDVIKLYPKCD